MENNCWVCMGLEPKAFTKKCKAHDICDVCKTKRADIDGIPWGTRTGFICQKCEDVRIAKAISDFGKEKYDELDFKYNDQVKCPYCGDEYYPDDLYESTDGVDCPNCSMEVNIEVLHSVTYSTSKPL